MDSAASSPPPQPLPSPTNSNHFVLIHGGCHGAWCWYKLVPLLKASGYKVTALDLASSGVHQQQVNDLGSVTDYFRPLMDFMASLPLDERVILVGHSFGGLAISRVMEEFPDKVSVAVFLTAFMPGTSLDISTLYSEFMKVFSPQLDNSLTFNNSSTQLPTSLIFGPQFLSTRLYQLSSVEDQTLATSLLRPVRLLSEEDIAREFLLSEKRYGSVKRVFIIAEKDLTLTKDFQQWMIRNNPPNETVEIPGSDHMVMMSKTLELGDLLIEISRRRYN